MAQSVFERYEKKYLLDAFQYTALLEQLEGRTQRDIYGRYTICNLYYDTPDYRLIRASLDRPVYKEKLRLRSYGVPAADSPVFVELKKKFKGVVYKRRAILPFHEAQGYLLNGERPAGKNQILDEIDWFIQFYRPEPKAFIGYDRSALAGVEHPELRITFDTNLRWRDSMLDLSKGDWGMPLRNDGMILMEIKFLGVLPLWLSQTLSRLEIYPATYSKYGACYRDALSKGAALLSGGKFCA